MKRTSNRRVPDPNKKLVCTPRIYRTSTGLKFWYDHDRCSIATSNPDTSIHFVSTGGIEAVMFVYLRMSGLSFQIAQKNDKPFPPSVYRGPNQSTTWVIGSLGVPLYFNTKVKNYRSLGVFDYKITDADNPVAVDRHFASKKQQNVALAFITEALAKYDGEWIGACRGEEQSAEVYIRPELESQLANGELLRP